MLRQHFHELPAEARQAIADKTGPVQAARTAGGGMNSGIAALLDTDSGPVFVKGIPADHPQAPAQQREAGINPHLPQDCPRLYWHLETAGWDLLGYEIITGRHAVYAPGSPDLPLVATALTDLQAVTAPADIVIKVAEQRWASYAPPGTVGLFAGNSLLHTDFAPDNVLIKERAHIIDWAWPTRGAAWIDPAVLILRLMDAGHTVDEADAFARTFPSWHGADTAAKAAFSTANSALWREIADADATAWKRGMAAHAAALAAFLHSA
ncbi:aminoglycoside phosphotransferase [Streptomyces sp. NBC_00104]|uniref:aminoglycoside phosphotransferase n=1 Tax=Streptomyces sp. NBC_00104 TaxID=2903621 RepID=UPI0032492FAC